MAPQREDTVESLKDLVKKLESRIYELEAKVGGNASSTGSKGPSESIRMILMGPPGAGRKTSTCQWRACSPVLRQGHPGSQDKRQVLRMPSGSIGLPSCDYDVAYSS